MTENVRFVQGVQGHVQGFVQGLSLLCMAVQGVSYFPACAWARARGHKTHTPFRKYVPLHTLHTLHTPFKSMTYVEKEAAQMGAHPAQGQRTIRCTPENAKEMQQAVKNWPELHSLVKDLHAANLITGLRALQITLSGPPEYLAKGLGALLPENGSKRD